MIDPHDMACQELVESLTAYLDGALDTHDRERLEAHLTICDDCRRYLEQFRATITLVGAGDASKLSPQLRNGLLDAFRSHDFRA